MALFGPKLTPCGTCGRRIAATAKTCPGCGARILSLRQKVFRFGMRSFAASSLLLLAVVALIIVIGR